MAMMGSTMPSSLRWRRSLMIRSSTTSVREPESMQTRPTLTLPALRAPMFVELENVAAFDQHHLSDRAVHGSGHFGVQLQLAVLAVDRE